MVTVVVSGSESGAGASLNTAAKASPGSAIPALLVLLVITSVGTGPALSAGAVAANEDRLPLASRIPVAVAARATVRLPTVVSAAPVPSVMVKVARVPATATDASVPPDGTPLSVHGALPAV